MEHFGCQSHLHFPEARLGGLNLHVLLRGRYPFYFNMPSWYYLPMGFCLSENIFFKITIPWQNFYTFQLKGVEPPGFSFQIVNTNMDEFSPRARRRSALLTWQHIASLPPSLPVVYCGGFNTQKESTAGRFLLGRSRYVLQHRYLMLLQELLLVHLEIESWTNIYNNGYKLIILIVPTILLFLHGIK